MYSLHIFDVDCIRVLARTSIDISVKYMGNRSDTAKVNVATLSSTLDRMNVSNLGGGET